MRTNLIPAVLFFVVALVGSAGLALAGGSSVDLLGKAAPAWDSSNHDPSPAATRANEEISTVRTYRITEPSTGRQLYVLRRGDAMWLVTSLATMTPAVGVSWVTLRAVAATIRASTDELSQGTSLVVRGDTGQILERRPRGSAAATPSPTPSSPAPSPAPSPSPAPASSSTAFNAGMPLEHGRMGSNYGNRFSERQQRVKFHHGIDIPVKTGTPIHVTGPGKVIFAGQNGGYGNLVKVQHPDGTITAYAHCSAFDVRKGDTVKAGQTIARVGNTGNSDCPHLHFEVWRNGKSEDPRKHFNFPVKGTVF